MTKIQKYVLVFCLFMASLAMPAFTCKERYADNPLPSGASKPLDFGHQKFQQTLKNHSK